MAINNIIFDFGGVLLDWNPRYLYRSLFDDLDKMDSFLSEICNDDWNIQQDAGRSLDEGTALLQKAFPEYEDLISKFYDDWQIMLRDEIHENTKLLNQLKEKGYRLFGLTNWSAETLPIAIERFDFFKELEGIVVSGEEKVVKPDKKIYQILLDRFMIIADESLFIDDNIDNIDAASELGFQTIHHSGEDFNLEQRLKHLNLL